MNSFKNKKILLCVCGGIAVYKSVELLRLLIKEGAIVRVVMTENAERFVSPLTFQALSHVPVLSDTFKLDESGITHIETAREAELVIVAPATANIIGKFATGIADDIVSTLFLALSSPVLIAPAMNKNMFFHPSVQKNIETLQKFGVYFVGPDKGELACGDEGIGRLTDLKSILSAARSLIKKKQDMKGMKILVTAGPTREYIDPVRFISNPSSGKMGYAIAAAAQHRGGIVTLISGPVALTPVQDIRLLQVNTADQMREAVLNEAGHANVTIMAAAVGDYSPVISAKEKIKKEGKGLELKLKTNRDIIREIGERGIGGIRIGFAAETKNLIKNAKKKLHEKKLDLIVANDVSKPNIGFGSDTNKVIIIDRTDIVKEYPVMRKDEIADIILDRIVNNMPTH